SRFAWIRIHDLVRHARAGPDPTHYRQPDPGGQHQSPEGPAGGRAFRNAGTRCRGIDERRVRRVYQGRAGALVQRGQRRGTASAVTGARILGAVLVTGHALREAARMMLPERRRPSNARTSAWPSWARAVSAR